MVGGNGDLGTCTLLSLEALNHKPLAKRDLRDLYYLPQFTEEDIDAQQEIKWVLRGKTHISSLLLHPFKTCYCGGHSHIPAQSP